EQKRRPVARPLKILKGRYATKFGFKIVVVAAKPFVIAGLPQSQTMLRAVGRLTGNIVEMRNMGKFAFLQSQPSKSDIRAEEIRLQRDRFRETASSKFVLFMLEVGLADPLKQFGIVFGEMGGATKAGFRASQKRRSIYCSERE